MKIGIVCYPTFGGSGVVATELGKALADRGDEVHFITYSQPVRLDLFNDKIRFHEVMVKGYPLFEYDPYEVILTSKMVDVVKREKLDVLHVHYAIPHASAAVMAKNILADQGISIPIVTTLHGTDITLVGKDPSFEPVITYSINHSDIVTAVSESLKSDTYEHFNTKKEIKVIPNFVCLEKYNIPNDECVKSKFSSGDERLLVHVSNFRKVKRVKDVIDVFAKVVDRIPAKLVMVGDGPERSAVEQRCVELGVADHVSFLGKVKEVERILCAADLFLLTSEFESFGLAALEAMAAGTPVVSSNTGGIPEINVDGVTGFLSNVGDTESMGEQAIRILENLETLSEFKRNSIAHAQNFSISKILPAYVDMYKFLL